MTVKNLTENLNFKIINSGNLELPVTGVYCCDLLSIVMSKAPAECAWVTVMGNINSVAVASLAEISVIIMADGAYLDQNAIAKAEENNINILISDLPVFETALKINDLINK